MTPPEQSWAWICVPVLLGGLATLVVGSQGRSDARAVAGVVLAVLGPLLLATVARMVGATDEASRIGARWALGFFGPLAGAVGLGYAIAAWREAKHPPVPGISTEPIPPDDELF